MTGLSRSEWVRLGSLIALIVLGVLSVILMGNTEPIPADYQLPTLGAPIE